MRTAATQKRRDNIVRLPQRTPSPAKQQATSLFLPVQQLFTHPYNLRRNFPEAEVREMAASIKSKGGVYQALLVVPKQDGLPGQYWVVDGNMRLAGARLLGPDCPPLECRIMTDGQAQQLLAMVVTCTVRYTPDPISQALHYKKLIEEEKYTISQISDLTGIHEVTIGNRLKLLRLDDEVQELIAQGKFPMDMHAVNALLSIDNKMARIKLAQRLAADGASIKSIQSACKRLLERLQQQSEQCKGAPALDITRKTSGNIKPQEKFKWKKMRLAAAKMCHGCDIRLALLSQHPEPAWALISHATEETCGNCTVREVAQSCAQCPAVTLLQHIAKGK